MRNEKISVIVPTYNSEDTLHRCLDSLIGQTYDNLEILVIDDESTDSTVEIIKSYEAKDSRVRYVKKDRHGGVSHSRNLGLEIATGEYIDFTDSDDYLEPNMLERLHTLLKNADADMAICNFFHPCIRYYLGNVVLNMAKPKDVYKFSQSTFAGVTPWNKLYKRHCIKVPFDENVHFNEDEIFVFSNLKYFKKLVSTDEKLYHYCVAPDDTPPEKMSCINKIARAKDFYLTRETYWFKAVDLTPIRERAVEDGFGGNLAFDISHQREFDFMIWELIIFTGFGCEEYGIVKEFENIFRDERFKAVMKNKEKHGIKYTERLELIEDFVHACIEVIRNNNEEESGLKTYDLCLDIFAAFFIELDKYPVFEDNVVKACADIRFKLTPESHVADKAYLAAISAYDNDEEFIDYALGFAF